VTGYSVTHSLFTDFNFVSQFVGNSFQQ